MDWIGKDKEYYKYESSFWTFDEHGRSTTEPEIQALLANMIIAYTPSRSINVLELGGYLGGTSLWLARALEVRGGGNLTIVEGEIESPASCQEIYNLLSRNESKYFPSVNIDIVHKNTIDFLNSKDTVSKFDFVFLDDWHETAHVRQELQILIENAIMNPGGIIVGHDTLSFPELAVVFHSVGGISLNLGKQGIGIKQIGDGS